MIFNISVRIVLDSCSGGEKKKKKTKFQEEYLTPENKYPIQLCTITILIGHVNL